MLREHRNLLEPLAKVSSRTLRSLLTLRVFSWQTLGSTLRRRRKALVDDGRSDGITKGIDSGPKSIEQPVDRQNQTDQLQRQSDCIQYDQHGDETGFGDAGGSDRRQRGGDGDHDLFVER